MQIYVIPADCQNWLDVQNEEMWLFDRNVETKERKKRVN